MSGMGEKFKWCCWLFVGTILLSSAQLTIVSLHCDDSSWFESISDEMGEEETEDTEGKEETNKREFDARDLIDLTIVKSNTQNSLHKDTRYRCVFREVFSPPPESTIWSGSLSQSITASMFVSFRSTLA